MASDTVLLNLSSSNGFRLQTSVLKDAIRIGKQANFSEQTIINRSSPVITYASSSPMTVDMALEFRAITTELTSQDINNVAKGLLSLTFPVNSGINPPPICTITVGSGIILNNFKCVCASAVVNVGENNLWNSSGDPLALTAVLAFKGIEQTAQDASDWASNSIKAYRNLAF